MLVYEHLLFKKYILDEYYIDKTTFFNEILIFEQLMF